MKHSIRTLVLAFAAAVMVGMPCPAQDESDGLWKRLPDMAVPRWEAGTVVFENKLYVFGGYRMPTKACKRVDVFDPKDNSWTKLADLPSAITHINVVLEGRSAWFAGGFKDGYKGYAISEVWRYDIDKNTYTAGPSLPEPRASGGLAIVGRTLHYVGGLREDRDTCSPKHWVRDLEKSDAQWEEAKPMSRGRCHFGTVTFDEKIYLTGGMYHHDSKQIDRPLVDIYDPEADSWSRGADLPTGHTHAEASTFVHDKRIFFPRGMAQVGNKRWIDNKITALTSQGKWKHAGKLPQPLSAAAAGILNGKLYLAGGSPNGATPHRPCGCVTFPDTGLQGVDTASNHAQIE
ncbi:MAG: Kelch repeat-containing protein, partial [Planctomycetota bacterium]